MAPTQCACVGPLSSGACHQRQPPQRELEPLVSERCNSRSGRLTTSRPVLAIRWLASNRTADDRHGGGIIHLHHTRMPGHDSFRSLPSREQGGGGKQPEPGGRRAGWSPMTLDIGPRHPQSQPTVTRPSFSGRNLTPPPMHWLSKDCRRPGLSRHAPNVAPPPTPGTHAREKRHRLMHKSISDPVSIRSRPTRLVCVCLPCILGTPHTRSALSTLTPSVGSDSSLLPPPKRSGATTPPAEQWTPRHRNARPSNEPSGPLAPPEATLSCLPAVLQPPMGGLTRRGHGGHDGSREPTTAAAGPTRSSSSRRFQGSEWMGGVSSAGTNGARRSFRMHEVDLFLSLVDRTTNT